MKTPVAEKGRLNQAVLMFREHCFAEQHAALISWGSAE